MVCKLALRHHEMMDLMMRALDHDAHEAERLELDRLLRVRAGHDQLYAIGQVCGLDGPADLAELPRVSRKHALDRRAGPSFASDPDLHALVECAFAGERP